MPISESCKSCRNSVRYPVNAGLEDLEDTVLMIEGISVDIVSDITTNIIREPLIQYTQRMCEQYEIPIHEDVNSGPLWNSQDKTWYSKFVKMPMVPSGRLLLVPKAVVRTHLQYDSGEYFRHFLLTHMQQVELDANSELVQVIKSGRGRRKTTRRRVTKKSLMKKYGTGKQALVRETQKYPEVLARYKAAKRDAKHLPLTLDDIASIEGQTKPDWNRLVQEVVSVREGRTDAGRYEKAIEGLLTALFYPNLTNPIVQHEIHNGRKRIDITYTNMALDGFFRWVATHYPAPHIFIECKNYGKEVGNPELDQLSSRFSPSRGKVGFSSVAAFKTSSDFWTDVPIPLATYGGLFCLLMIETLKLWLPLAGMIPHFQIGRSCKGDSKSLSHDLPPLAHAARPGR
jgi:hypothetical protein